MKNKKARTYLLTIGVLLLTLAVLSGSRPLPKEIFSAQVQTNGTADKESMDGLEEIADDTTPLAGAAIPTTQTVQLISKQEPIEEEPAKVEPVVEEPAEEEPAAEEPAEEEPAEETPVATLSVAQRLLERAQALLTQYNACTTMEEKRILLGASNYSLGNDALRTKLLADMGGSWEQLEEEVVDATEYQQDKTLYVQVYMSGSSSDFTPVVYTTANSDRSGNQWSTNLVYVEDEETWMEYVKKHKYNDSRVGYYVTELAEAGTWDALQEEMETSELWQEVTVEEETPAEDAAPLTETAPVEG